MVPSVFQFSVPIGSDLRATSSHLFYGIKQKLPILFSIDEVVMSLMTYDLPSLLL